MYICKRERKRKQKINQTEAMKSLKSTIDSKNLIEFILTIEEMIYVRGGEESPRPGTPPPPVVI